MGPSCCWGCLPRGLQEQEVLLLLRKGLAEKLKSKEDHSKAQPRRASPGDQDSKLAAAGAKSKG